MAYDARPGGSGGGITTTRGDTADGTASRVLAAIGTDPTQAFVLLEPDGRPRWASPELATLIHLDPAAVDPFGAALHPDDAALVDEIFRAERVGRPDAVFDPERRFELLVRLRSPGAEWRWCSLRLHNRIDDPAVAGMVLQITLANQERSTVEAFDAAATGEPLDRVLTLVLETLRTGGAGDAQAAVFDLDGRCLASTSGAAVRPGGSAADPAWAAASAGRVDAELPVVDPAGRVHGTLVVVSDFPDVRPFTRALTAAVARRAGLVLGAERARRELHDWAMADPLTGLRNRRHLIDHLERADDGRHVWLAFVDLDGFKSVNDRFGHRVGDAVLMEVARRLRALERPGDVVARLGGDEFVLVRTGHPTAGPALAHDEIVAAVSGHVALGEALVAIEASVGVVSGPASRRTALIDDADALMYAAKPHRRPPAPPAAAASAALPVAAMSGAALPAAPLPVAASAAARP